MKKSVVAMAVVLSMFGASVALCADDKASGDVKTPVVAGVKAVPAPTAPTAPSPAATLSTPKPEGVKAEAAKTEATSEAVKVDGTTTKTAIKPTATGHAATLEQKVGVKPAMGADKGANAGMKPVAGEAKVAKPEAPTVDAKGVAAKNFVKPVTPVAPTAPVMTGKMSKADKPAETVKEAPLTSTVTPAAK